MENQTVIYLCENYPDDLITIDKPTYNSSIYFKEVLRINNK